MLVHLLPPKLVLPSGPWLSFTLSCTVRCRAQMNHPDIAGFPRIMAVDALDVPSSSVTAKQLTASWDQPLPLLDSNSTAFSAILWAMIVVPDPLDAQASLSLPSASLPPLVVANLTYKSSSAPGTYALAANQQHQDSKSTTPAALQVHQLLLDIEAWNARRAAKPSSFSKRQARRQYYLSSRSRPGCEVPTQAERTSTMP